MGIWVSKQCPKCHPTLVNGRLPGTTASGRYRTYEAFSGCDLDPVHVSDYHQVRPPAVGNTKGYSSTYLAMGFASVRASTQKSRAVFGYPPEH